MSARRYPVICSRRRWGRLSALLLTLAIVMAACGSDDPGSKATTASSGGSPAGTASAAASGEPIRVMSIAPINTQLPSFPNIHEAAQIYSKWINDRGGINGRPLEVVLCDDRGDPNEAANCGREAAKQNVVAIVGSFEYDASQLMPILEQDNIALFGSCCPAALQEFASPMSFAIGGNLAIPAGVIARMVADGCKSPAVVYIQTASWDWAVRMSKDVFDFEGFDSSKAKFVPLPAVPQDYSAQVAQAMDGTDCIYGGMTAANWAAFLPAMQSQGGTQRLYGHQGNVAEVAEQYPALMENAVVVNAYPGIEGPMWNDFRAALKEYDAPDLDWNSPGGLGTWAAFTAFVFVVKGMDGEIDHDTFLAAADKVTALDTGGMVPVLDLSKPWEGMGGGFPRNFNRTVTYDVVHDGKVVPTNDPPVDMTEALDTFTG